jgi:hypothetical protein
MIVRQEGFVSEPGKSAAGRRTPGRRPPFAGFLLALAAGAVATPAEAALTVALNPSPASPAFVGTMIHWTAEVSGGSSDLWYRFRVLEPGSGDSRLIRDYGPVATLDWTSLDEGVYTLELSVRDRASSEVAATSTAFELVPRAGDRASVAGTSHPLVVLFSSPGCDAGRARVRYESTLGAVQFSPFRPCVTGKSLNFYLSALAPSTSYSASLIVERGREVATSEPVPFSTGAASYSIPLPTIVQGDTPTGPERILLQAPLFSPPFATDVNGKLLWIGPADVAYITRPEPGGTFFAVVDPHQGPAFAALRKFDLVGMTVLETNAARVSEQLVAMGKRPITGFHHEIRSISGNRIVALASTEQILTDVQGPGAVDVLADMIVVFDSDLQVVWTWDAFDHLDVTRKALLNETCLTSPGCAPYYLAADANDWTHANALAETPDGAFLLSIRHQDWLVKINYQLGAGNGDILWRLGKDGDFTIDSDDGYPWFSHQHDAAFEPGSDSRILLFDNGNTHAAAIPGATSRGQLLELDEANRTARLVLNADMGVLSGALGSAQKLSDGGFHFEAGLVFDPANPAVPASYAVEVSDTGDPVSTLKMEAAVYRSFRLTDLLGETPAPSRPQTRTVAPRAAPAP